MYKKVFQFIDFSFGLPIAIGTKEKLGSCSCFKSSLVPRCGLSAPITHAACR